jgi:photosystem II stability/assembly factor-like uncharacterized protein
MKTLSITIALAALLLGAIVSQDPGYRNSSGPAVKKEKKMAVNRLMAMMADHQFRMQQDPATGEIPAGIRSRELDYSATLPNALQEQPWIWRGPANIGGRMLCVAVDIHNENHLLAGSASGGMWESNDQGQSWHKTTAPDAEQSATCVVQDKRPGKGNIWYYGTGELLSTTNRNVSTNARTIGIGNGIFKSTDNGTTWQPLPATQGGSHAALTEVFQGTWRIVTDPVRTDKDIVYAACYGAIMRSEDGGQRWDVVLGDLANKSYCTDIAVTSDGIFYAALSSFCFSVEPPLKAGIWRSVDGINWRKISPVGLPTDNRVTRLALAPSNENVLYLFTESQHPDLNPFNGYTNSLNTFWKMTWDAQGDVPQWENRTKSIPGHGSGSMNDWPFSFVVYGGYTFTMGVKPDNENVVFLGGMYVYRSDNGFADSLQSVYIGGYPYDMDSIHQLHPDQHGITFLPSNPSVMFLSNDGGIYRTDNCLADSADFSWNRLNNNLTTTQFYSVAIDHGEANDDWILGGLQDNNWYYTVVDDPGAFWFDIDICYDGFATAVARHWEYCAISAYSGNIWTTRFNPAMHTLDIFPQLPDTLLKFYDPVMGSNTLFPFYQNIALDPVTNETFYLPTVTSIWRKDNLKAAAYDTGLRNAGWNHLEHVDVGSAAELSCLAVSPIPANRLYYGSSLGKLYRLDNANTGNPTPTEITGSNFPANAFIAYIDIDPANADNVLVVFSNYSVLSIFSSVNGGLSWTPVSGNLEEHPDGTGAGPSVRCVKKLTFQGHTFYLAGTTTGLYSTRELKGDSTIWSKEGATSIGSVLVDDIDVRKSDGFIAVGTHGNGVYSCHFDPSAGIADQAESSGFRTGHVAPNPACDNFTVKVESDSPGSVKAALWSEQGRCVRSYCDFRIMAGAQSLRFSCAGIKPGIYFLKLVNGRQSLVRKVVIVNAGFAIQ